jgi:hypothetical protein
VGDQLVVECRWEGLEESFGQLELGPDPEWNEKLSPEKIRARLTVQQQEERERVLSLNAQFSKSGIRSVEMRPFYWIHPELWAHPKGIRLYSHLQLMPFEDWNRIWLPTTETGAWVMRTFPHPGKLDWLEETALDYLGRTMEGLKGAGSAGEAEPVLLDAWRDARTRQAAKLQTVVLTALVRFGEGGSKRFASHAESCSRTASSGSGVPDFVGNEPADPSAPSDAMPGDLAILMAGALFEAFTVVGRADGRVDDKEKRAFVDGANRHLSQHADFAPVLHLLANRLEVVMDLVQRLPSNANTTALARFTERADDEIGPEASERARKLIYFVSHEVAASSGGGLLGLGSKISKEEDRVLELLATRLRLI